MKHQWYLGQLQKKDDDKDSGNDNQKATIFPQKNSHYVTMR